MLPPTRTRHVLSCPLLVEASSVSHSLVRLVYVLYPFHKCIVHLFDVIEKKRLRHLILVVDGCVGMKDNHLYRTLNQRDAKQEANCDFLS